MAKKIPNYTKVRALVNGVAREGYALEYGERVAIVIEQLGTWYPDEGTTMEAIKPLEED